MCKRGDVYHSNFRSNGRRVRERLSTDFDAACTLLNELRARADLADFDLLDNDYPWAKLKTEFIKWAKQTKRPRVAADYEQDLKLFESFRPIRAIAGLNTDTVVSFRTWRLDGGGCKEGRRVTARTINRQVGTVVNMLNKGVEWKRIGSNPLAGVAPLPHDSLAKERRALTMAELLRLFECSPDYLKPVWRMLACSGIRKGELVGMTFDDVDFEGRSVTIKAGSSKTHKPREIPLDDTMLAMLQALKDQAGDRQPVAGKSERETAAQAASFSRKHVFVTKANTPMKNNLLTRFYGIAKRAGIADARHGGSVDIHSLRVTFTTLTLEHGANPKAVQAILGHTTLAMTMNVYAKATERAKREVISSLPFAIASAPDHVIPVQNGHAVATTIPESPEVVTLQATA
jgi:integrase